MLSFKKTLLFITLITSTNKDIYSDFSMPISADLEHYKIQIGYGFSGEFLTLFGVKEKLNKIAIFISGPERNFLSMKRIKFHNLWIQKKVSMLLKIPSFDARWISEDVKDGVELLNLYDSCENNIGNMPDFSHFLSHMETRGLYKPLDMIDRANNNIFRVKIPLPNNATTGKYRVNVMSFNDEMEIEGKTTMSFEITHSDFNKFLYTMNKENHKTYLMLLFMASILNVLVIRYFFVKKS